MISLSYDFATRKQGKQTLTKWQQNPSKTKNELHVFNFKKLASFGRK
jgi:hypothetical protein